jgi:DNA-binding GntR family transcriptional regulator
MLVRGYLPWHSMSDDDTRPRYDPGGRKRVFVAIADDLTAKIQNGTYPADGRLPSVNDLVHEYGAARETVRKAIHELAERGWVEIVPGKGVFVTQPHERRNDGGTR